MTKWKAQVNMKTGSSNGSTHLQWVEQEAKNSFEARLAIESKYGRIVQGPIMISGNGSSANFHDNF